MAATTTLLGLVTPTQGTLSGTWGDTVNYGISDYVDISVAGTLTLTNDGAVTLANTTGSSAGSNITSSLTGAGTVTAQFAIVKVTGTLTVAKVVTGPSYSKTYTVVNSATGGIVTFKASGQTGVSVAVGETAFVYFNGTDYVKIVGTATAGAAGGSNTQVQFNSSGILAGSSSLTWDGTTLSSTQVNITGQGTLRLQDTSGGEYVGLRAPASLAGNYTLTFPADDGTSGQALITDGSGVLSWSTAASGDVYGPGSSTDNAVARFDSTTGKLLQNSVVLIGDTGAVTGVTDLTASGSVTLSGGTANGVVYLNGSKVVTSGGSLVFNGTRFSNVVTSDTNTTVARFGVINSASTDDAYLDVSVDAANNLVSFTSTGNNVGSFAFLNSGTENMRLTSTGLGIGTSSPSSKLQVNVTSTTDQIALFAGQNANNYIAVYDGSGTNATFGAIGGGNAYMFAATGKYAAFYTGGSERLRIDSAGNLGLGVTPSAWVAGSKALQIGAQGAIEYRSNATSITMNAYYDGAWKYIGSNAASLYYQYLNSHVWSIAASGTAGNAITFTQAMTLDASGNLGIGTTTPAGRLDVVGTADQIRGGNGTVTSFLGGSGSNGYTGTLTNHPFLFYTNSSLRATLDTAGNLGLGVTPSAWSGYGVPIIQLPNTGTIVSNDQFAYFGANWYYATSAIRYITSSQAASYYGQTAGAHKWFTAPSGTAGNAITFTQAMTLDASGNLLVGTTSGAGLGVSNRAVLVNNQSARSVIAIQNTSASGYSSIETYNSAGSQTGAMGYGNASVAVTGAQDVVYLYSASAITFLSGGTTERMRLDASGNLGLGVTPSAWASGNKFLDVNLSASYGAFGTTDAMMLTNAYWNGTNWLRKNANNAFRFVMESISSAPTMSWLLAANGAAGSTISWTQAMTLDASGNLGIGTTSITSGRAAIWGNGNGVANNSTNANSQLHLVTTDSTVSANNAARITFNAGNTSQANAKIEAIRDGLDTFQVVNVLSGPLVFGTNNTERVRIDSSGNFCYGVSSFSAANNGFLVSASGASTYTAHANGTSSGATYSYFYYNNSEIGSITQSGTTAVLYNITSDQRLKENIQDADSASSLIDSLQVRQFDWKADGSHQRYGFVAQELATVYPEAVHQPKDAEEMMAVDYSKLVPLLVKEIQSLKARLDAANL